MLQKSVDLRTVTQTARSPLSHDIQTNWGKQSEAGSHYVRVWHSPQEDCPEFIYYMFKSFQHLVACNSTWYYSFMIDSLHVLLLSWSGPYFSVRDISIDCLLQMIDFLFLTLKQRFSITNTISATLSPIMQSMNDNIKCLGINGSIS